MQINRLFEIIYLLLDKKNLTAKDLAEHFEVSTRTIYRDVETLSSAGIPIYMSKGKGGGINLLPDYVLNKAVITEKEREEILSSLHAIGEVTLEETNTALDKLSALFGETSTDWVEVDFNLWSDGKKEAELYRNIKNAILRRHIVMFSYASAKGERMTRTVEPMKLIFKGMAWYLYGYCRFRQDYRYFKLKRIRDFVITEDRFQRENVLPVLGNDYQTKPSKSIQVKLKFSQEVAYRVYDEYEEYTRLEDGSFLVEVNFNDRDYLIEYVLAFGGSCVVLEPAELRQQISEKIKRLMEQYQ